MAVTIIYVDLLDAEGFHRGRSIPVIIEYITDVDKSYGEDADGRGATTMVCREILDASIAHDDLVTMNVGDIEYCLDEARHIFSNRIR